MLRKVAVAFSSRTAQSTGPVPEVAAWCGHSGEEPLLTADDFQAPEG